MATNKIANTDIYTNSYISQEWGTGYKLEVDLTSDINALDWELNLKSADSIRDAYGVNLVDNGNGNYSISGQGDWEDLEPGETAKAIFIVDSNSQDPTLPKFTALDSQASSKPEMSEMSEVSEMSEPQIAASPAITQDWKGGYKIEVDLSSEFDAKDWSLNFELNHNIRDAYGVDLVDNGNGNYSISGQGDWQDLEPGETAKAIFVVDDNGQDATLPQFDTLMGSVISDPLPAPLDNSDIVVEEPKVEPAPADNTLMGSVISDPQPAPQLSQPSQLSSDAITVGFENHANNTSYNNAAQSKDWNVAWSYQMDKYGTISNQDAHSGNNSLRMTYPANAQANSGAKWQIPGQQEYYLSYWVKFDGNFDFDGPRHSGGKLPGLGSGDLASGGNKPNGNNGFTSRYMWRENGKAVLYLYHMDQPSTYGQDVPLTGADGNDMYFERGQWHNMVQRVKANDGSQSNGEIDVWMDGEQVLDMDGLRFMTNNQGIDTAYFSTFHGGNGSDWWPDNNVSASFDDFVVSTNAADVGL